MQWLYLHTHIVENGYYHVDHTREVGFATHGLENWKSISWISQYIP